jgi:uncharacterized protein GlcG (DUF336 family)
MPLTLSAATTIIDAALAKGRELGLAPLTAAVLDAGGHLVALKREDGSGILRVEVAVGKAWGSLGLGFSSRRITEMASQRPAFANAIAALAGGRFVPSPGGVLIRAGSGAAGAPIGAIGISGDLGEKDELCAIHGVIAAGLAPDPATPV